MFESNPEFRWARVYAILKPSLVILILLFLTGCSSAKGPSGPQVFSWSFLDEPVVQRPVAPPVKRDLEDDGLPSQEAPGYRVRQTQDDPSQPWSRNYGRAPSDVDEIDPVDVTPVPEKLATPKVQTSVVLPASPAVRGSIDPEVTPAVSSLRVADTARLVPSRTGVSRCRPDNGGWRCAD